MEFRPNRTLRMKPTLCIDMRRPELSASEVSSFRHRTIFRHQSFLVVQNLKAFKAQKLSGSLIVTSIFFSCLSPLSRDAAGNPHFASSVLLTLPSPRTVFYLTA